MMPRSWTFNHKLALGFALPLVLTLVIGGVAVSSVRGLVAEHDALLSQYAEPRRLAQRLDMLVSDAMASYRGYYLTGDAAFLTRARAADEEYGRVWQQVATGDAPGLEPAVLDAIERAHQDYAAKTARTVRARVANEDVGRVVSRFDGEAAPAATRLKALMEAFITRRGNDMDAAERRSREAADHALMLIGVIATIAVLLVAALAFWLTRTLSRQLGSAVGHLQSSSTELQAAANQQATGSGEQATAMTEVSTTMKELLATSRQIAQSAQSVARIADETAEAARSGDANVQRADEAVATIRHQVDMIVAHMLDLGKKTQQIGAILEIIKELAEQTNILSINATIEAAGAGESGKRFAAVAEEIRKLADRVGGSAGEIRVLIEEIRAAANTTVMATEDGSKAVDAGTRQFDALGGAFHQIVALVEATVEASREIELSTKQQATAVEQVNVAIHDAAQAARETESSSRQTLQTSSQLADLSRDLVRMTQARRGA